MHPSFFAGGAPDYSPAQRLMLELISVHVPKCAGRSFALALERAYGPRAVYLDYGDRPLDPGSPMNVDPERFFAQFAAGEFPFAAGKRVIHGHFHVAKYRAVDRACRRITFLRHPVDRTISHHSFWLRTPRHGHRLHDHVLDERLGVVEFAQLPFMQHFYERVFFAGVQRGEFDFIGSFERLDEDMLRLEGLLERPLARFSANSGAGHKALGGAPESEVRARLAEVLAQDIAFYQRWCAGGA